MDAYVCRILVYNHKVVVELGRNTLIQACKLVSELCNTEDLSEVRQIVLLFASTSTFELLFVFTNLVSCHHLMI